MQLFQYQVAAQVSGYEPLPDKLHEAENPFSDPPPAYEKRDYTEYVPVPQRMRLLHIPKIAKTSTATILEDPLDRYLLVTEQDARRLKKLKAISRGIGFGIPVRKKKAYQIDNGDAFMCYTDPRSKIRAFDKVLDKLTMSILALEPRFYNEEQRLRLTELQIKLRQKIPEVLGKRNLDMLYLDHVGTVPEKRGRGYATTLCKLLTTKADVEHRATWLISSNVKDNTGFYNNLGFFTVGEVILGDANSRWTEAPVTIAIMVREPRW